MEQELITAEEHHAAPDHAALEEEARLAEYHRIMVEIDADLPRRGVPNIAGLSRKRVMQAFQDSFELIGVSPVWRSGRTNTPPSFIGCTPASCPPRLRA